MKKNVKPQLFANIDGCWVPVFKSKKMRVAMCLVYEDSAMPDWITRLRRWHIPVAISPLHDKDTWDDVRTPLLKTDEEGEIIYNPDGSVDFMTDANGDIVWYYFHHKGDIKKPHWHVMIAYGAPTTEKVFQTIIDDIGGVIPPLEHMQVSSPSSMFRYFAHKDDPDKTQYDMKDCVLMGGFDPVNYETYLEKNEPFKQIMTDIKIHKDWKNYRDILEYYRKQNNDRLFYFACNHTLSLTGLFK